jgi:hypothetical protein
VFPALVSDGAIETKINAAANPVTIQFRGSTLEINVLSPTANPWNLEGPRIASHTGYMQALAKNLPAATRAVHWQLRLHRDDKPITV